MVPYHHIEVRVAVSSLRLEDSTLVEVRTLIGRSRDCVLLRLDFGEW